jgi:hypothetical protein
MANQMIAADMAGQCKAAGHRGGRTEWIFVIESEIEIILDGANASVIDRELENEKSIKCAVNGQKDNIQIEKKNGMIDCQYDELGGLRSLRQEVAIITIL